MAADEWAFLTSVFVWGFFCCFFFSFTCNSVLHHLRAVEEAPVVRWGAIVGGSADPSICVGHAASCGGRHRSKSNTGRVVAPASIHTPLPATPPQHQPASPHTHATPHVYFIFLFWCLGGGALYLWVTDSVFTTVVSTDTRQLLISGLERERGRQRVRERIRTRLLGHTRWVWTTAFLQRCSSKVTRIREAWNVLSVALQELDSKVHVFCALKACADHD